MKSILVFLFTVLSLSAYSQALDSISVVKKDSSWYLKRITAYEDGSEDYTFKSIGDSLLIVNYLTGLSFDAATQLAAAGATVAKKFQIIKLINSYDNALEQAGLKTTKEVIHERLSPNFISDWKCIENDTVKNAEIFNNTNGVLKIKINEVTKSISIFAYGWIRIHNYPVTGENKDLFQVAHNLFVSADRDIILKR